MTTYNGQLYLGGDNGGIHRLGEGSKLETIYGFDGGEVSALAANDQYLYAAVNQRKKENRKKKEKQNRSQLAEQLKQEALQQQRKRSFNLDVPSFHSDRQRKSNNTSLMLENIRKQTRNKGTKLFAGLSGSLVYRMKPPKQMNIVYNDPDEIVHDLATDGKDLFVATGGKGRLYKVRPDFTRIAYFKAGQKLVLDMELKSGNLHGITTGEGGVLHQRMGFESGEATYRSKVLDAQLLARWGQLNLLGNDGYQVRTRSGNTPATSASWSDWSPWQDPSSFDVPSDPARFLQFGIRFLKQDGRIRRLTIAFGIPNQRPQITKFEVSPNPIIERFLKNRKTPRNNSSKRQSSNRKSRSQSGRSPSSHSVKKRSVSWKIMDPDGDPAQTRLFYRPMDGDQWVSFTGEDSIEKNQYSIDLRDLSDGRYRLKLVASDKRFNDPESGFTTQKKSAPILVDNTQPDFRSVSISKETLQFTAKDGVSRIVTAQYRVQGRHWQSLQPEDGVFDELGESFSFPLPPDAESGDLLQLRLLDEGGNQAVIRRTIP